ncbi:MAG TPA: pyrroloquinoline quinone biosynthesis peptide chaperone PqqD [Steroidobacteraceae bacterium]|nr:pyrroloquinoline quinone biosynthesis peptide chaperone PqqD [Steroidobacteraceae bacterium]
MSVSLADTAVPRLPRGVRLRQDEARGGWVLLAPERILQPDPVAVEILTRIDGRSSLAAIVDSLTAAFAVERERIDADVRSFLGGLAEKGFVEFDA